MRFLLSRLIPKRRTGVLVLRIGKEEIDFLFFKREGNERKLIAYGSENLFLFNVRQTLEKIFVHLARHESIQELVVTFEAGAFRAQLIQQTFVPRSLPHLIGGVEAFSIERETRIRAGHVFQKALFRESGILPKEFALRRVRILERRINGYTVRKLAGFKSGTMEFSLLGMFLLESSFTPVEQFAKVHKIRNLRVVHMVEGLHAFLQKNKQKGVYLCVEEEKTQIVIQGEDRFLFPGLAPMGSDDFTESLVDVLGMGKTTAKVLQSQYFANNLSLATQERVQTFLLPELKKFGTLIKKKLNEAKITLPEFVWIFGRGGAMRNLQVLFGEDLLTELPFAQKPNMNFLLPRDVWGAKNFSDLNDPLFTLPCLIGAQVK